MKKMWKALAVLTAIALFGSAFTACKSDDDDDDDDKAPVETPIINVTAPETAGVVSLTEVGNSAELYNGNSVQGALEKLMTDNLTGSYIIKVAPGTYKELLFYTGSATITIEGTGTAEYGSDVLITYSNSGNSNAMQELASNHSVTNGYFRGSTRFDGTCNLVLKNVTIQNSYSRSANDGKDTQAEAVVFSSTGNLIAYNSTFLSHQDTLYLGQKGGRMWFYKDYIAGDVDFIWGYMDVALFEECQIYCRGDETDKAYIFASRAMAEADANKGIVLLNNKITIASGLTAWYGRNSGADTNAAILNSTIIGAGTLNSELYQSAPGKFVKDAAGDLAIGYKDYNNTMNGVLVDGSNRKANCGALTERVANREYNGRYVILNRGYSEEDEEYETADVIWDISAYEEEFGATEDKSSENIYVDPVYVKNLIGGQTVQLEPSSDVADLTYTYASSNPAIATVSESGLVTAIENVTGTAVITVTASNGKTDTMTVAVIPVAIPVTEMALKIEGESIPRYGIATAKISFTPADATYQNCTLTSDNPKVKFYDPTAMALKESVDVEGIGGSAEIFVWFGDDVSGATITAASTAEDSNTVKANASVSTAAGKVTWSSQAGSYRVKTDIQGGKYGIFDGLVIDSLAANSPLITENGKMSLKTAERMQTRNVILYIPVEGAATVAINLTEAATGCSYHVGENLFTSTDNIVFTYNYDGSKTGIVLGSEITGLGTAQATVGKGIENNGKYLRVDVVRDSAEVYLTSIDVTKTGEFTANWDIVEQTGAEGDYNFGSEDSVDASNNYASTDGFVTGTGITADGQGHGYAVAADSTINIKVDGMAQIDILGCAYGKGAPFKATVGETVLADVASCKASTDGDIGATFYYTTAKEADIVITFSNAGWVHGVKVTKLDSWNSVTGIVVTDPSGNTNSTVTLGDTLVLTATVTPENATVKDVIWSSSDETVATVSKGTVTTLKAGTTTITATAKDGSAVNGTYSITVEGSFDATAATVSWDLSSSTVNIQKILGNLKGVVTGSSDYTVRAIVDATVASGKLQGNGTQHAQMNNGTIIKVPVTNGAILNVTASSAGAQYALYTIAGTAASTTELTSTYTHSGEAAWISIVSTGTAYPASIEVTGLNLNELPAAVSENYGWDEASIVADSLRIESTSNYYDSLYVDATSGKFASNNTSWTACNAGTVIYVPMSKAGKITFTPYGAYKIVCGSTEATTTAGIAYTYEISDLNNLVDSGVEGDSTKYAKITFTEGQYISKLSRVYSE